MNVIKVPTPKREIKPGRLDKIRKIICDHKIKHAKVSSSTKEFIQELDQKFKITSTEEDVNKIMKNVARDTVLTDMLLKEIAFIWNSYGGGTALSVLSAALADFSGNINLPRENMAEYFKQVILGAEKLELNKPEVPMSEFKKYIG